MKAVRQQIQQLEKQAKQRRREAEKLDEELRARARSRNQPPMEAGNTVTTTTPTTNVEQLLRLQMKMHAITHLQSSRPKTKFGGGRKIDFAKHLKAFSMAVEAPEVSARQKLQEQQHYFEGTAYSLVESDILR